MTKEELMNILRMFETGNEYSGIRMILGSDNLHVGVFKWDYYPGGNYYWQEPEYMESLDDEYTLLEIAQYIEESMGMSAYWHTVAEDIRLWCDIHYTQQQLIKVQQDIKDINTDLDKGDLEEDEIRQLCNALNQLLGYEDNLKWKIDVLLNK